MKGFKLNIYTITAFIAGFLFFLILFCIVQVFEDPEAENIIAISSILVNIGFGVFIYFLVEKKVGDDRAVKSYFTEEIKELKADYRLFLSKLNRGEFSAREVNKWFKLMTINMEHCEYFINKEFQIPKDSLVLQKFNRKIQMKVTGSKDFNDSFSKPKVKLGNEITSEIIQLNKELKHSFTGTIVKISRS